MYKATASTERDVYSRSVVDYAILRPETTANIDEVEHQEQKTNDEIASLSFIKSRLKFLPRRLDNNFPNITKLSILKCGLKSITREDLKGLEELETLNLLNNLLKKLPNDLFVHTIHPTYISFFANKLDELSSEVLKPIFNGLQYANFLENANIDVIFSNDGDQGTTDAKHRHHVQKAIAYAIATVGNCLENATVQRFQNRHTIQRVSRLQARSGNVQRCFRPSH